MRLPARRAALAWGLPYPKRIIEMQGRKIWIESQVGQGQHFAYDR
jgi:hypothetical protein